MCRMGGRSSGWGRVSEHAGQKHGAGPPCTERRPKRRTWRAYLGSAPLTPARPCLRTAAALSQSCRSGRKGTGACSAGWRTGWGTPRAGGMGGSNHSGSWGTRAVVTNPGASNLSPAGSAAASRPPPADARCLTAWPEKQNKNRAAEVGKPPGSASCVVATPGKPVTGAAHATSAMSRRD